MIVTVKIEIPDGAVFSSANDLVEFIADMIASEFLDQTGDKHSEDIDVKVIEDVQ